MADESRIERELSGTEYSYDSRIEEFIAWLNEEIPTHPEPKSRIEEQLAAMTPGGGGSATLIEKSVTDNGVYNASDDSADGYSKVAVDVPTIINITQSDYDNLSTSEKMNGNVYNIPKLSTAKDMANVQSYCERSMSATSDTDSTEIVWDGTDNIGANFYYMVPVDVANLDYIEYDLTLGTCYGGGSTVMYDKWSFCVGITQNVPFSSVMGNYSSISFISFNKYTHSNQTLTTERLDVSELTGTVYLTVYCPGWNAEISDVLLVNNINKLYYLDVEYDNYD